MADFFLSLPGLLSMAGVGALILLRSGTGSTRQGATRGRANARLVMQIVISLIVLGAGLWVILSGHYTPDSERWASGAIGTVMGYWLKP
jgi:hypothetical protein